MCAQLCPTLGNSTDYSSPGSSVHGILKWFEYCSSLPFPSPEDLPNPGMEPAPLGSPALAGGFFAAELPKEPLLGRGHPCVIEESAETQRSPGPPTGMESSLFPNYSIPSSAFNHSTLPRFPVKLFNHKTRVCSE